MLLLIFKLNSSYLGLGNAYKDMKTIFSIFNFELLLDAWLHKNDSTLDLRERLDAHRQIMLMCKFDLSIWLHVYFLFYVSA